MEGGSKLLWSPHNKVTCHGSGRNWTFLLVLFRQEVDEFFQRMDRDYDGRLSFEEFMGEESQIEKLFKNMDKNGDGFVNKQVQS